MITYRRSKDRGHANHGWLDTFHSFSFNTYHNPDWMKFSNLRVLNEDRIEPGYGFAPHPHQEMEIITYVIAGEVKHEDNAGGGGIVRAGDVQVMSAGTGIMHSEVNPSDSELLHLIQIWLLPDETGVSPRHEQRSFPLAERRGELTMLVGPRAEAETHGALGIHANSHLYGLALADGQRVRHELARGRRSWVQVIAGQLRLNGAVLSAGDGAAISQQRRVELVADGDVEGLLFDLA
jgi:redox-sensitive bicupin YhaK (pirin superfamily)